MNQKASDEKPTAERLIEVAGEIFAQKGLSATVREICSAANCSVAAINYYFGDKNQLYIRCIQTACEKKQKLFPFPQPESEMQQSDPAEVLQLFLRTITRRLLGESLQPWYNTLMLREVLAPSEGVAEMLQEAFQRDFGLLHSTIGRLLGPELDSPDLRAEFATQILSRCMFLRTGSNLRQMLGLNIRKNESPEEYANSIGTSILMQVDTLRHSLPERVRPKPTTNHDDSVVENK
ncbi:MAG: CerR family C-terminal domain-containing protein [Planctomycetota bacterium]